MALDVVRYVKAAAREAHYQLQRTTKVGFDVDFEHQLEAVASDFLSSGEAESRTPRSESLESLALNDESTFDIFRHDIYRRFDPHAYGPDTDQFGREGRWVPRGTTVYYDKREASFVKVFDEYTSLKGEARYLDDACSAGLFDFLCPNLDYLIRDELGRLRGYSIREGRPLSRYEFERYIGHAYRDVILQETARTGFYFYDLEYHNVIVSGDQLSLIDLESILPIAWFGTGSEYSMEHLDELDVGWPLQSKWRSPHWYEEYLTSVGG